MTTDDKIREAFDTAQVDPKCASFNLDSFSFHLGYKAALSSLEQVAKVHRNTAGQISIFDPSGNMFDVYKYIGEPLYRIAPTKECE